MSNDSVIVVDEIVVPEMGVDSKVADFDMVMMSFSNSMERTEAQWRAVLESAGLKMREIVRYDEETCDSLIFAVKE